MVCFQGSPRALGCCIDGVCGTGAYPLPDLPREASRSRYAPEKSVQFGPDGAPFQEVAAAKLVATQVEAAAVTPPVPPSEHPPPQKLAAASRIQTAWRNRAAPTPPGEPVNDLRLALEAHSELKAHEARSATRKPLRPRN